MVRLAADDDGADRQPDDCQQEHDHRGRDQGPVPPRPPGEALLPGVGRRARIGLSSRNRRRSSASSCAVA